MEVQSTTYSNVKLEQLNVFIAFVAALRKIYTRKHLGIS